MPLAIVNLVEPSGLWTSSDDGASWQHQVGGNLTSLVDNTVIMDGLHVFGDGSYGLIAEEPAPNVIFLTSPDGLTWTRQSAVKAGTRGTQYCCFFADDVILYVDAGTAILRSLDHGLTWQTSNSGVNIGIQGFCRILSTGRIVSFSSVNWQVITSDDLGLTWANRASLSQINAPTHSSLLCRIPGVAVEMIRQATGGTDFVDSLGPDGTGASDIFTAAGGLASAMSRPIYGQPDQDRAYGRWSNVAPDSVSKFDGTSWSTLGASNLPSIAQGMRMWLTPAGNLVAILDGQNDISRSTDGTNWTIAQSGFNNTPIGLALAP